MDHLPWERRGLKELPVSGVWGGRWDPGEVDTKGCSPLVRWTLKEMQPGRGGRGGCGGLVLMWVAAPALNLQFPVWWILQHLKRWLACAVGTQE